MTHRLLIALVWLSLLAQLLAPMPRGMAQDEGELAVVVHVSKAATAGQLGAADLQAIFTRRKQFWGDGSKIIPLNLVKSHPARLLFDQVILGFDSDAAARFWIDQQVRGGARAPIEVGTPELALRTLQVMPDAVCYVPANLAGRSGAVVARIRAGKVVAGR
jgi:hypothetical protein